MANSLKNYYGGSWVDISDYLDRMDEVPVSLRNNDYTLKAENIKIAVPVTIRNVRTSDFEFAEGDKFSFHVDDEAIYQGLIETSEYDYAEMVFDINLYHALSGLRNIIIDYSTLHAALTSSSNWWEYTSKDNDFFGHSVVGLLWTLQKIFSLAGFTLDVSGVQDTVVFTDLDFDWSGGTLVGHRDPVAITYKDLFFIEQMLYCTGNAVAANYATIDSPPYGLANNKVNGFDFVSEVLSSVGLLLKQTDIDSFSLIFETENYAVTDDSKFEYAKKKVRAEAAALENISCSSYGFKDDPPYTETPSYIDHYQLPYGANPTDLNNAAIGNGKDSISFLTNLQIFYSDAKNNASHFEQIYMRGYLQPELSADLAYTYGTGKQRLNLIAKKIQAKINSYMEEEILTDYQSEKKTVIEHNVDMEWNNSRIVQETFE